MICVFQQSQLNPVKEPFNPQRGHDLQVETCCAETAEQPKEKGAGGAVQ